MWWRFRFKGTLSGGLALSRFDRCALCRVSIVSLILPESPLSAPSLVLERKYNSSYTEASMKNFNRLHKFKLNSTRNSLQYQVQLSVGKSG